jgi:hypothetical protein
VGLSREERRDWYIQEGRRIAWVQDQQRAAGWRVLASKPPKGLDRSGRRAWTEADRANRRFRFGQETRDDKGSLAAGAGVLLVIVTAGAIAYAVLGGHHGTGADSALPNSISIYQTPTSTYIPPTVDPSVISPPEYVALGWLEATCGSTPDDPAPARFARSKDLMTPAAYAALSTEIPSVGWNCVEMMADIQPGQLKGPNDQIVTLRALIEPLDSTPAHGWESKRHMVRQADGHWLVGPVVGE